LFSILTRGHKQVDNNNKQSLVEQLSANIDVSNAPYWNHIASLLNKGAQVIPLTGKHSNISFASLGTCLVKYLSSLPYEQDNRWQQ
jgi:hypothetical protein